MYFIHDEGELWFLKQYIFIDFHWMLTLQPKFNFCTLKYDFFETNATAIWFVCVCVCILRIKLIQEAW